MTPNHCLSRTSRTAFAFLAIVAAVGTSSAKPAPVQNLTSPQWSTAVTFDAMPPRAHPRPGSSCETANSYVSLITSDQAAKVPALFAPAGELIGVANKVLRGRAEIAAFYDLIHQPGAVPLSFMDDGPNCIMELAGSRPNDTPGGPARYKLVAIDHFTIGADRSIERLVIFFRPDAIPKN